jgi:hypothetical protein
MLFGRIDDSGIKEELPLSGMFRLHFSQGEFLWA